MNRARSAQEKALWTDMVSIALSMRLDRLSFSALTGGRRDCCRRCARRFASAAFGLVVAISAHGMEPAPAGATETGVPAFVVMGPEALGLSSAPLDFQLLPDSWIIVASQRELAGAEAAILASVVELPDAWYW